MSSSGNSLSLNSHVVLVGLGGFFALVLFIICLYIYFKFQGLRRAGRPVEGSEGEEDGNEHDVVSGEGRRGRRGRRQRSSRRQRRALESTSEQTGLEKSVVEQLPKFVWKTGDELECAVCLEEFAEGESGRILPKCGHCFHVECIDMWLYSHSSCPLCRCQVGPSEQSLNAIPLERFNGLASGFLFENRAPQEPGEELRLQPTAATSVAIDMPSNPLSIQISEAEQRGSGGNVLHSQQAGEVSPVMSPGQLSSSSEEYYSPRTLRILQVQAEGMGLISTGSPALSRENIRSSWNDRSSYFTIRIQLLHDSDWA